MFSLLAKLLSVVENPNLPRPEKRESLRSATYKDTAAEIFILAGVIGAERPDLVPGIFEQVCEEPEKSVELERAFLAEIFMPHDSLESLPYIATASAVQQLEQRRPRDPSKHIEDWRGTLYTTLSFACFLSGCILGYDQSAIFWEMLRTRLRRGIKHSPLPFCIQIQAYYSGILSEKSQEALNELAQSAELKEPDVEGLLSRLLMVYQEAARELLESYQREFGPL